MATTYSEARDAEAYADRLMTGEHARFFEHLEDAPITYLLRDPPATSGGLTKWATTRALTGLNAYLATNGGSPVLFVVEIAAEIWDGLDDPQREALIDHELSHIVWDPDEGIAKTRGHDVEEFYGTVARHGHWRRSLELLATAGQMSLDLDQPEEAEELAADLEPAPA